MTTETKETDFSKKLRELGKKTLDKHFAEVKAEIEKTAAAGHRRCKVHLLLHQDDSLIKELGQKVYALVPGCTVTTSRHVYKGQNRSAGSTCDFHVAW